jgi:hypothetical protein
MEELKKRGTSELGNKDFEIRGEINKYLFIKSTL